MPSHYGILGPANQPTGIFQDAPRPQQEEEPKRKRGFMDVLAEIFTGAPDPRLSEEQREAVRRDALITAGLQMAAAGGRTGLDRVTLLQALAEGAGAGRQAGGAARRSAVIGQLASGDPTTALPQFRQMFVEALQAGDAEGARSLATVINAMEASLAKQTGGEGDPYIYRTIGNEVIVIDKRTGEEVSRIQGQGTSLSGAPTQVELPDGTKVTAVFDRSVPGFRELGTGRILQGAKLPDDAGVDPYIAQLAPSVGPIFMDNIRVMEELGPPNVFENIADQNDFLRYFTSEDAQRFNAAGDDAVSVLILIRSGRQASDRERRMLRQALIPRPGDKPQVVAEKLNRLRSQGRVLIEAAQQGRNLSSEDIIPELRPLVDGVVGAPGSTPILDEYRNRGQ